MKIRLTLALLLAAMLSTGCITSQLTDPAFIAALGTNTNSIELEVDSPRLGKLRYRRNLDRATTDSTAGILVTPETTLKVHAVK